MPVGDNALEKSEATLVLLTDGGASGAAALSVSKYSFL